MLFSCQPSKQGESCRLGCKYGLRNFCCIVHLWSEAGPPRERHLSSKACVMWGLKHAVLEASPVSENPQLGKEMRAVFVHAQALKRRAGLGPGGHQAGLYP